MPSILIEGGGRIAPGKMAGEDAFRTKLAEGFTVYTRLNNVYFQVTEGEGGAMVYTPQDIRPTGL